MPALLAHAEVPVADVAGIALVAAWLVHRGSGPRTWRWAAPALVALGAAAAPPLAHATETSAAAHMVQHLLMVAVAAPLLGLALATHDPAVVRRRGAPGRRRGVVAVALRRARRLAGRSETLVAAGALHGLTLWAWHAPVLYRAADASAVVHALEHATFLGTGVALWTAVAHHVRRRSALVALGVMSVTALHGAALGALLTFSPRTLIPEGSLFDQQVAGILMWSAGGPVSVIAAVAVVVTMLGRLERRTASGGMRVSEPSPVGGTGAAWEEGWGAP